MIVPSIDLMNGRAVQLRQGKDMMLEAPEDPLALLERFSFHGEVAVIDLDLALGQGSNRELVRRLCAAAPCRVGGGVRREEDVVELIQAGARQVIVGTAASEEFLARFPPAWMQVALDARHGKTVDSGWRRDTGETPIDRARRLEPHCSGFLFTQVEVEGTLGGVPLEPVRALREATSLPITVAGGVAGIDDILALQRLGCDVQVGMALYTGRIDLDQVLLELVRFDGGLLPTVVTDERGTLRMLAWSSRESLKEALAARRGVYFSRSRDQLWTKGETSGHTQELVRARYDCDADSLLFVVRQTGPACHTGRSSCFGEHDRFDLGALAAIITARRGGDPERSYTARLLANLDLARAKVLEEAQEACAASDRRNLVWELADLFYHSLALMAAEGLSLPEIEAELRGRHR